MQLNAAQQQAVLHEQGVLLVLAGAGSGKTRVITEKIRHLIEVLHYKPSEIVAVTFTNKAALEMQTRVRLALGKLPQKPKGQVNISTFHSLGLKILRQDAKHLGYKDNFSILDSADCKKIIQDLLGETDKKVIAHCRHQLSLWKNQLITPELANQLATNDQDQKFAAVYAQYQQLLRSFHALDFDDLIFLPLKLLREHESVLLRWQHKWQYLLVDEYQDTNQCQYELLKWLVKRPNTRPRLTVVGDDDQSIYGWRGANSKNIINLQKDFPELTVVKLEQNYRSSQHILRAANQLITKNPKLFAKQLWSELGLGEPINILTMRDEEHEAESIVFRLSAMRFEMQNQWRDYAILYRSNHQARLFEKVLRRENIPYQISGGQSFFDKTEIKDIFAYLRLLVNPNDDPAFIRAITTPKRGIGEQTLVKLAELAAGAHQSLFAAAQSGAVIAHIAQQQYVLMKNFVTFVEEIAQQITSKAVDEIIDQLLQGIDYEAYLYEQFDDREALSRWENVLEFIQWLKKRGTKSTSLQAKTPTHDVDAVFDNVDEITDGFVSKDGLTITDKNLVQLIQSVSIMTLLENHSKEQDTNAVQLSTIHASKGLEYGHVFIVGVEENILPFKSNVDEDQDLISAKEDSLLHEEGHILEERRIMYVAVTRAQKSLTLSYCRKRKRSGQWEPCIPSRFIEEMGLNYQVSEPKPSPSRTSHHLSRIKSVLKST